MTSNAFLSYIGKFLLATDESFSFGTAITTIDIYVHFKSTKPPLKTLDLMLERFEVRLKTLPLCWFKRKNKLFEVAYYSEICSIEDIDRQPDLSVFNGLCVEVVEATRLISKRIKSKDDFDFGVLCSHFEQRLNQMPTSESELSILLNEYSA